MNQGLELWLLSGLLAATTLGVSIALVRAILSRRRLTAELARREEELRIAEEKFERAFRLSSDALAFGSIPEGRLFDVNATFLEQLGYEREDVIGRTTQEIDLWADPRDRELLYEELGRRGRVDKLKADFQTRSGEARPGLLSAEIIPSGNERYLLAVISDLYQHEKDREALRLSEEKFKKAFYASPDSIVITRIEDGRILDVNEGFERLSGYSRDEAVGHLMPELRLWSNLDDRDAMLGLLREKGRVRDFETHMRPRGGGEPRASLFSAEIVEIAGELCLLTVGRDVHKRKKAEAERDRFVEELEQRNAELERFIYTVSHDLRTPLVTIGGFLGLLERDALAGDAERLSHDIGVIHDAALTMRRLLDEILELSQVGRMALVVEEVDLGEIAREAVAATRGTDQIEMKIGADLPVATVDRFRFREVFVNLVGNAVRFMGEQAHPSIEIGRRQDGNGSEIVCFVRDNGVGIDPRYLDKVFGLFDQLDAGAEGTGIGLALVQRIVETHGGRVWAESEGLGRGSTFCFSLPR